MAIPGNFLSATTESIDPNTSGWRARLNCTLLAGTGGRNGPGTLVTRSVAAGEVQAETVATYPVLPGETYQTFADAGSASQPERMGIEWLTAAGVQVGLTWSLTTSTASASWHRVGVAGVCPVGATRARLVLSATMAGAAVNHSWENAYLGLPKRTLGNLLSFNVESGGELNTSGWAIETNGTVGRLVPPVSWSATAHLPGAHVVTLTATAAGNTSMVCTERPVAHAGVEYLAHSYLGPPTMAAACWIELRFYDAAGNQLQATRGQLAAPGTSLYRQRVAAFAPAGTASASVAVGITGASAGQVLRLEGVALQVAPRIYNASSVVPYEDASFEQGVGSWTVVSGAATIARSAYTTGATLEGPYTLAISSGTGTSVVRSGLWPISAGDDSWRRIVGIRTISGSWSLVHRVRWYDAAQQEIGSTSSTPVTPVTVWAAANASSTSPAGAVYASLELEVTATGSSVLWADMIALWRAAPYTEATAHEGTGSITVTLRELPVGAAMTLYRVGPDGQRDLVRGPDGMLDGVPLVSDFFQVEDYEAPLGIQVRYRVEMWSAGTMVDSRNSPLVTLPAGDPNTAWLKDPAWPQRNLRLMAQRAPDWQRPIEQQEYRVRGARNTVVHSDVRGGLEGDLTVWTRTDDERVRLHWLLDSGHVLLLQAAPGMGLEDVYVSVGDITEARVVDYAPEPWRAWTLALTQVDMPTHVGVGGTAGRSWQDVLTENETWQQVMDRYATWEDVLLDKRIGG